MLDPFIVDTIAAWVSDFVETPAFGRLAEKEHAPDLLTEFLKRACELRGGMPGDITDTDLTPVLLDYLPGLALPMEARLAAPEAIAALLEWLQGAGRLADGAHLGLMVMAMADEYRKRVGPSGLRMPPRRAPAPIGRNDPCPCGSGKKYKKCCGANS